MELLTLSNFTGPAIQVLPGSQAERPGPIPKQDLSQPNTAVGGQGNNLLFPCDISLGGKSGELCTLFAESSHAREYWRDQLEAAIRRRNTRRSDRTFDVKTLDMGTFYIPSKPVITPAPSRNVENPHSGKVTCSTTLSASRTSFSCFHLIQMYIATPNSRKILVVGCGEGVWAGLCHEPQSACL